MIKIEKVCYNLVQTAITASSVGSRLWAATHIAWLCTALDEEKENQDLQNVQKQIYRLKEQLDSLPEKVEQLSRDTKREESILETKKTELERSENNKRLRMKEYAQGISFYQQLLGLEFERFGGGTSGEDAIGRMQTHTEFKLTFDLHF